MVSYDAILLAGVIVASSNPTALAVAVAADHNRDHQDHDRQLHSGGGHDNWGSPPSWHGSWPVESISSSSSSSSGKSGKSKSGKSDGSKSGKGSKGSKSGYSSSSSSSSNDGGQWVWEGGPGRPSHGGWGGPSHPGWNGGWDTDGWSSPDKDSSSSSSSSGKSGKSGGSGSGKSGKSGSSSSSGSGSEDVTDDGWSGPDGWDTDGWSGPDKDSSSSSSSSGKSGKSGGSGSGKSGKSGGSGSGKSGKSTSVEYDDDDGHLEPTCDVGAPCSKEGSRCTEGTETCCGKTFDSLVCDCAKEGDGSLKYMCFFTDACFAPSCETEDGWDGDGYQPY